jgi:mono/diheme cytochrome c family protein
MTNQLRLMGGGGLLFLTVAIGVVSNDPLRSAPQAAPTPSAAPTASAPDTYKSVYDGWKWWHVYCYRCHGVDAVGTTNAPSLIDPSRKLSSAEFLKVVMNGVPDKGMQAWDKLLERKQVAEIHMYVRARTDKVLPPGRPDEVGPNGGPWVPPAGWPGR